MLPYVRKHEHGMKELDAQLKELGMTKAELAKALGILRATVYKWKVIPEYVHGYLILMKELKREKDNGPA